MKAAIMNINHESIRTACRYLKNDGIIAIPTDTFYVFAANIFSAIAIKKIV